MKRIALVLLAVVALFGFTSCGGTSASVKEVDSSAVSQQMAGNPDRNPSEETSGKKVLVVYYSATGHTKRAAEIIAVATKADIMRLEPDPDYTQADLDYNNPESRVSREHRDESLRYVPLKQTVLDHWDGYDTVFIGYPIWWGIAAWPVDAFIQSNDFTGKNVIPFCTSASSLLGDSGKNLETMATTGNWQPGKRFEEDASEQEIRDWLKDSIVE